MTTRNNDGHLSSERLQAFLDGDLSKRDRSLVEEHLQACARCTAELGAWRSLFADLGEMPALRPHEGFSARVMSGVKIPEAQPLPARLAERARDLVGWGASGHLDEDVAHALVDGQIPRRRAARVRRHLEACEACAHDVEGWAAMARRLDALPRFGPSDAFADRVMSRVTVGAAVATPAAVAAPRTASPAAWLRRAAALLPRKRGVWAALSGAAVTPVVTLGVVLWVVFSNPAVTPGALAAYAWWQLTDLAGALWGAGIGVLAEAAGALGLGQLAGLAASAPVVLVAAATAYSVLAVLALRVLYRNLVTGRPVGIRHAQISRS